MKLTWTQNQRQELRCVTLESSVCLICQQRCSTHFTTTLCRTRCLKANVQCTGRSAAAHPSHLLQSNRFLYADDCNWVEGNFVIIIAWFGLMSSWLLLNKSCLPLPRGERNLVYSSTATARSIHRTAKQEKWNLTSRRPGLHNSVWVLRYFSSLQHREWSTHCIQWSLKTIHTGCKA
jgi:hypothetical protein